MLKICKICKDYIDLEDEEYKIINDEYYHEACIIEEKQKLAELDNLSISELINLKPISKETQKFPKATPNFKKCYYCSDIIDIANEPFKKINVVPPRYAHEVCYEENYNEDVLFIDPIYQLLKEVGVNYDFFQCNGQRKKFIKQYGYTNEEIYNTLKYFYKVKHNSPKGANRRIGIVPHVHDEAMLYFNKIKRRKRIIAENIKKQLAIKTEVISIKKVSNKKQKNLINLDLIGDGDN